MKPPQRPGHRHVRVLAILLRSLTDYQPGPGASLRRGATRLTPTEWASCPSCKGDMVIGKTGRRCDRCRGRGGWYVDPYDRLSLKIDPAMDMTAIDKRTGKYIVPTVDEEPEGERARTIREAVRELCQLRLPELEQAVERVAEKELKSEDPLWLQLEKQVKFRTSVKTYREIVATMKALRVIAPYQFRAMILGLVMQLEEPRLMPRQEQLYLLEGLRFLSDSLPDGFRAPRWARDQAALELAMEAEARRRERGTGRWGDPAARVERDREIARLRTAGWGPRAIGRRLEVTHWTVMRVLAQQEEAA